MTFRSLARFTLSAVVFAAFVPGARGQQARPDLLVSTGWLAAHLNDPGLVLLHVGSKKDYEAEHIPGARFVSLNDISTKMDHDKPDALMLQMPASEELRTRLAALGISDNSRVIVYYGTDWVTPATRVVFTLDYAGLGARTSLLDGGMSTWKREGHNVTAEKSIERQGSLSALRVRPIIVDADYVKSHIGKRGISVVDGRAASFYDGIETGEGMRSKHKTGHIAGAKSVPYTEITDDNLIFRTREQLAEIFAKAGVQPGDTIVGYCHIGQQATGMLFAGRLLGHPVLLYDGSFEDWSKHPASYAVEVSTKGTK
ncbi:MAG TPA: rhodanese-like domain-containing protein [Gemmatimonadaceae bacterium]|nr:rhodanese-like domain-containing protein [Gemmatimonadaceae bacterium]